MLGSAASRPLGIGLLAASLLLAACNLVTPATPTPVPAQPAASADGAGRGPRGQGGPGGQGAGQGRGAANGQGAGQGADDGQGRGFANGQGGPGGAGGQGGQGGPGGGRPPGGAAQGPIVSGDVDTIEGHILTVVTNTGSRRVDVPDGAAILTEGKGTTADLVPGALVGVTGKQDGTAIQVRIFAPGVTPRTGQFPMNGANAGNVMTNATIDAFDGKTLTVDIDGAETKLSVPADVEVLKPIQASFADITQGTRVAVTGSPSGDVLEARQVTILTGQRNGRG